MARCAKQTNKQTNPGSGAVLVRLVLLSCRRKGYPQVPVRAAWLADRERAGCIALATRVGAVLQAVALHVSTLPLPQGSMGSVVGVCAYGVCAYAVR
jgi:hypothetical protein